MNKTIKTALHNAGITPSIVKEGLFESYRDIDIHLNELDFNIGFIVIYNDADSYIMAVAHINTLGYTVIIDSDCKTSFESLTALSEYIENLSDKATRLTRRVNLL